MRRSGAYVIVNPAAGAGRAGRLWPRIAERLRTGFGGEMEQAVTAGPGHATALTREALGRGYRTIVAVGGDGTFGEVACGFFDGRAPVAPDARLGLVPGGTGCDLPRSLGTGGLDAVCGSLGQGGERAIDVGHAVFRDHAGGSAERVFINVASFGCGGAVAGAVARADKRFGGRLTFLLATGRVLARYRDQRVALSVDGRPAECLAVTNLAVCNAAYFGGGMWVAPGAALDDGLFDVTIWAGFRLGDFLLRQNRLYDGRHVQDPRTRRLRGRVLEASSDEQVLLDLDGENPGMLPVRVEMLPGALRLLVPAAVGGGRP